jgi:LCP family protein required for cell wall assembly
MQPDNEFPRFQHPDAMNAKVSDKGLPPEPVNPDERASAGVRPPQGPRRARRARGSAGKRLAMAILMIIVLAGLAYAAYIVSIVAKISSNPLQLTGLSADASGRTNVLVLGLGDPGHSGEKLSDTIMLLSLDGASNRAAQISLPRDLRVNVPGYGFSKINAANARGGVELAEQTVSNTLDVPINYYLTTNFSGLKNLVDAAGGIDVDVKTALIDREYPCEDDQYKVCGLNIQPGLQHMDGTRALQYVRCRKGTCGNDFGRSARQQEVMALLRPKLTDWHLVLQPAKLALIAQAAQAGIKTDMGLVQLITLASRWQDAKGEPAQLVLSTGPGGYLRSDPSGSSDLLPIGGNFTAIQKAAQEIFETP